MIGGWRPGLKTTMLLTLVLMAVGHGVTAGVTAENASEAEFNRTNISVSPDTGGESVDSGRANPYTGEMVSGVTKWAVWYLLSVADAVAGWVYRHGQWLPARVVSVWANLGPMATFVGLAGLHIYGLVERGGEL